MRRKCRERFPRHRLQRKPLVSDQGTCVTAVPGCMSGSLTRGGRENVPGACATRNFTHLARGPWEHEPTNNKENHRLSTCPPLSAIVCLLLKAITIHAICTDMYDIFADVFTSLRYTCSYEKSSHTVTFTWWRHDMNMLSALLARWIPLTKGQ